MTNSTIRLIFIFKIWYRPFQVNTFTSTLRKKWREVCLNKTNNLSLVLLFYFPSVPLCIYSYSICCTKLICRELRTKSSPTLMTQTDRIKKQRHHFANKGPYSQSYVFFFPVVMNGCESWAIKKAEHQRTDAFKLWCWRRLLRVSWTTRRSNQSILKEINPEYSSEGLMLEGPSSNTLAT